MRERRRQETVRVKTMIGRRGLECERFERLTAETQRAQRSRREELF
jgi:hypothetical protein